MVAHLVRFLGPAHLSTAEEAVQDAMVRALQSWPYHGVPEHPEAWLFRTARNLAIDAVRRHRLIGEKSEAVAAELMRAGSVEADDPEVEQQLRDDELRMILMCCHPALSRDAAVALSLKLVCGLSVREIARAFLAEEPAIAQRLVRARRQLAERRVALQMPSGEEARERPAAVLRVLYFLFNEGYAAHEGDALIRADLCQEALRLGLLLAASSLASPEVHALVALMAFHAARAPARVDAAGDLVLLEDQDRTRWDERMIALGFDHFNRSIAGETVTEYHVEAAIAATHLRTLHSRETDWPLIVSLYDQLLEITGSPIVALNRAVAVSKVHGAQAALDGIAHLDARPQLRHYHLLLAVRGHLLLESGRKAEAAACFRAALECRCSEPERRFLAVKLAASISE